MQKIKILANISNLALVAVCLIPIPKGLPTPFSRTDLVVHFISYLVVTSLFLISYKKTKIIIALLIAQGILIEIIQPFVNRYFEWFDIGANTLGVVGAYIFYKAIVKVFPARLP